MARIWPAAFGLLLLAASAGCGRRWANGECETSQDCKEQQGFGQVCVQGHCEECGADADCKAGFVCAARRCSPGPECGAGTDCPPGRLCEGGRCVADPDACGPALACSGGRACVSGRCQMPAPTPAPAPGPCEELGSVYFDFDRSLLSDAARGTLEAGARCLRAASVRVVVEGNCDERGTADYNLHLGQRRADAVRRYLRHLGVRPSRIATVSFGEERPLCAESTEACWQRNRRADVRIRPPEQSR